MLKSEIFADVLGVVSAQTEIPADRILSPERTTEVVDAKYILIYIMKDMGFYPEQIARLMHQTPANIRKVLSLFHDRVSVNPVMEFHLTAVQHRLKNSGDAAKS